MKRKWMILFGNLIIIISIISLIISVPLSIYGNLYPKQMMEGNIACNLGYLMFLLFLILMTFTGIFVYVAFKKLPEDFNFKLKAIEIIFISIGIIYCIYRMFFFKQSDELLGLGNPTLMIYLALGVFLNIDIIICIPKIKRQIHNFV